MTLKPLSASQISTFRACPRSWGWTYLEGRRPPGTKSTDLGGEIHRQMESWLKESKMPTIPAAQVLVKHVPAPGIALAEGSIAFNTASSPWRGAIDAIYDLENGHDWLPRAPFTTGHTVVLDFKSTADLKYAKTAEHLANEDPQASLYAYYAFGKGAKEVHGAWLYSQTRGLPAVKPVRLKFDRIRVEDTVAALDKEAGEVQKLYQIRPKTLDLEPRGIENGECNKWGGCAHASYCLGSPIHAKTQVTKEQEAMSNDFASFINNKFGNGAVPSIPTIPAPVAPPPPVPSTPQVPSVPSVPAIPSVPSIPNIPSVSSRVDSNGFSLTPDQKFDTGTGKAVDAEEEGITALKEILEAQGKSPEQIAHFMGDRPRVEHGTINSPEGPEFPFATPEEMNGEQTTPEAPPSTDVLESLDRDTLKAHAIKLGVMTESNRYGAPKIVQLIKAVDGWREKLNLTAPASEDDLTEALEKSIEAVEAKQQFSAESELSTGGVEPHPFTSTYSESDVRRIVREEIRAFFAGLAK